MKKIIVVVGARPNFMKAAPLLRELENEKNLSSILVHTGQHYDEKMSDVFFEDLGIKKPEYMLKSGSGSHSFQTGKIMEQFENVCTEVNPDLVIVFGDINSTMACSIVAKKMHITLAHVEAGLRSNDRDMPEEINRLLTDAISDIFFITEDSAEKNLLNEGHDNSKIHMVGNLMIDSLYFGLSKISNTSKESSEDYGLITLHRPSNVDDIQKLKDILHDLSLISKKLKLYFSMHPRTKKQVTENNLKIGNIELLDSLPYLKFLELMKNAKAVFTDSGGIQEECTVLKIPCYTLRYNTERPITVTSGTNRLVNPEKNIIFDTFIENQFDINPNYSLPLGWDGKASKRIVEILNKKELL